MLKYFLQYEFIFLFRIPKMLKTEQRVCLVLPEYMKKVKKPMDLCMKKSFAKFFMQIQKLCYACWRHQYLYLLENERNFKKLLVTTKIA